MMPLLLLLLILLGTVSSSSSSSSSSLREAYPIAKPGCTDHCGQVDIPYPFGIGKNCFYDPSYEIVCNNSSSPPKPFLQKYNFEVMEIKGVPLRSSPLDIAHENQTLTVRTPVTQFVCTSDVVGAPRVDLGGSPYRYSTYDNVLLVQGCSGSVLLKDKNGQVVTGCATVCAKSSTVAGIYTANCHGVGCCEASLSEYDAQSNAGLEFYEIALDHRIAPTSSNTSCTMAAAFVKDENRRLSLSDLSTVTVVLDWHVPHLRGLNSHRSVYCTRYNEIGNYVKCYCNFPYIGNPYYHNGCKAPIGCQNHTTRQYYCPKNPSKEAYILGFSIGTISVLGFLSCYWVYRFENWRKRNDRKAKCFKSNGGLLLQQQMSSNDAVVEKLTIFTIADLERATDNFHENRIIGQGGQGTVYKGMLMDGRIVAVKRSKKVDEGQLDQFINEVVILSQVNHRNVVRLLGCCLETEVPLLVSEFIPNGTLYQHIHNPTEDFHLTWKMRLQIAAESAGALAYLHSSSSIPIYHRDIKTSNILLDEKYRAKVSDFGTSRAISIEQTHVTTNVQGTYGYLDPEYFQSNQFTEKSDVYSFGVVLVELITGMKPVYPTESGGWKSLALEFRYQMENSTLLDILDKKIIEESKEEDTTAVANLARQCLNMNGKQRPTMKEVAMILDGIMSPNLKEPSSANGKRVITELSDSGPSSTNNFSDYGSFTSLSV